MKIFLSANIIGVSDVEKASKWYSKIFGMKLVTLKLPHFCHMRLGRNDFLIEQHSLDRPVGFQNIPTGVRISAIIGVDDIHKFIKHVKKNKVKIIHEQVKQKWGGWNAIIRDPYKNEIIIDQDD